MEMKSVHIFIMAILTFVMSCSSSKSSATDTQIKALDAVVTTSKFHIESNWAYPQTSYAVQQVLNSGLLQPGSNAGAINLVGNSNFLTISGDSITSYLPYFGERQMQVAYGGGDGAIEFKGLMEDYKVEKNKDQSYNISLSAKSHSESFNVIIRLFPNLRSDISLTSASRFPIRYSGEFRPIE